MLIQDRQKGQQEGRKEGRSKTDGADPMLIQDRQKGQQEGRKEGRSKTDGADLMSVLDVPLQVNLLAEVEVTQVTVVVPDVSVNLLVTLQVAARCCPILTLVARVGPQTCN